MSLGTRKFSDDINIKSHNVGSALSVQLVGSSSGSMTMQAASTTTPYTVTFPGAVATLANQVLTSDTSGNLSWTSVSAIVSPTTPGLPLNSIQYNLSNTFAGSANLTYNGSVMYLNGYMGIQATPTAMLTLGNPVGSPQVAPLKFTSGTLLGTPQAGAIEYDGSELYVTDSTPTRHSLLYTDTVYGNSISTITIYINQTTDPTPGNDITGNGSAAYPYATLLKALQTLPNTIIGAVVIQFGAGNWNVGYNECLELNKKKIIADPNTLLAVSLTLSGLMTSLETVSMTQGSNPYIYNVTGGTTPWTVNQHQNHFVKGAGVYYVPIESNTSNTLTMSQYNVASYTGIYQCATTLTFTVPFRDFVFDSRGADYMLYCYCLNITTGSLIFLHNTSTGQYNNYQFASCNLTSTYSTEMITVDGFFKMLYCYVTCSMTTTTKTAINIYGGGYTYLGYSVIRSATGVGMCVVPYNKPSHVYIQDLVISGFTYAFFSNLCLNCTISHMYFKGGTTFLETGSIYPIPVEMYIANLYIDSGINLFNIQTATTMVTNINIGSITSSGSYTNFASTSLIKNKFVSPNLGLNIRIPGTYPEIGTDMIASLPYNAVTNVAIGDLTYNRSIVLKYTMMRGTNFQQGTISILHAGLAAPLIVNDYQNSADLGVTFDAIYDLTNTNQIDLVCTANNQDSNSITFNYNVERVMY